MIFIHHIFCALECSPSRSTLHIYDLNSTNELNNIKKVIYRLPRYSLLECVLSTAINKIHKYQNESIKTKTTTISKYFTISFEKYVQSILTN